MKYLSNEQIKFILPEEVDIAIFMDYDSAVLEQTKMFKIDQRITSSICYTVDSPIVNMLLEYGIQLNVLNARGETPIYEVVRSYNLPLFIKLLEHGASMYFTTNINKEKAIDTLCKLLLQHCNYNYIVVQYSTILKNQISEVAENYSLQFIDKFITRIMRNMWRPIAQKIQQLRDLKPIHRRIDENFHDDYASFLQDIPDYPKDMPVKDSKEQPIHNIQVILQQIVGYAERVQDFFKSNVLHLEDIKSMKLYAEEVKEMHAGIYKFMEVQLDKSSQYDQLLYNFQEMIDDTFHDESRQPKESELFEFILQIIMLHIDKSQHDNMLPVIKEQLMTLEGDIKKRIQYHVLDPSKDINIMELTANMFDMLSGMPAIQGRSLTNLQNLVVLIYEKAFNVMRDIYFHVGSIHMKIHILLSMAHATFEEIERRIER